MEPVNDLLFVVLTGSSQARKHFRLLVDSLRTFGRSYGRCPIWLFEVNPGAAACQEFEKLGIRVLPLTVPDALKGYILADKVAACARAEELAPPGVKSLVWLNPECFFTRPPELFDLAPAFDAALRPVHIRNVGLPVSAPLDEYWERIYAAVGAQDTDLTVESFVDGQRIRAYYNTHAFAVTPQKGLFRRWQACFEALVCDRDFQQGACRDELHQIFLHQAVLSALLATTLQAERICNLPPEYSYPYHLHASIPPARRAQALNDLVCVVYEPEVPFDPGRMSDSAVNDPLKAWFAARSA